MSKIHLLKIKPEYFWEVTAERKRAELRLNDRDYKVGDYIVFTDVEGNAFDSDMAIGNHRKPLFSWMRPFVTYLDFYEITNIVSVNEVVPKKSVKDYVMLSIRKVKKDEVSCKG